MITYSFKPVSVFSESDLDWDKHFTPFKPTANGYSVLVDLDAKILTLYEDSIEIKSWPVSGGKKENPSPTGSWIVSGIESWGEGFGGSWIGLNVPWGKYGIHGTVEPWAVGDTNISHGCIRMKNQDVAELKKYLSVGDLVYIKYDSAPFRTLKDGKVGSDVLKLQIILKQLNFYDGTLDGNFGTGTFEAVCRFQAAEQITVDGKIGQESWNILLERARE